MINLGKPKKEAKAKYDFNEDTYSIRVYADGPQKSRTKIEFNSKITNDWGLDKNSYINWGTDEAGQIALVKMESNFSSGTDVIIEESVSHISNKPLVQFIRAYFNMTKEDTFDINGSMSTQEVKGIGECVVLTLKKNDEVTDEIYEKLAYKQSNTDESKDVFNNDRVFSVI